MKDVRVKIEIRLSGDNFKNAADVIRFISNKIGANFYKFTIEDIYQHFEELGKKPKQIYSDYSEDE